MRCRDRGLLVGTRDGLTQPMEIEERELVGDELEWDGGEPVEGEAASGEGCRRRRG